MSLDRSDPNKRRHPKNFGLKSYATKTKGMEVMVIGQG